MHSYFLSGWCVLLVRDSMSPTHPCNWILRVKNVLPASLRYCSTFNSSSCKEIQPINSVCWGANQRKCSFLLVLHWLQKLSVNFQNWENCEPNKFTWDYSDSSVVLVFEISVISCDKLHRPVLCGVCTLIAGLTFCCVHCREWHVTSVKAENIVDRRSGSWWLISKFISSKTCKFITLTSLPNCWLRWYGFWHDGAFGDSI